MREIKFRAYFHNKVTKEKRMINWEEISSYNGCGVILKDGGEFYHVMQSTGLKDKNGKEIQAVHPEKRCTEVSHDECKKGDQTTSVEGQLLWLMPPGALPSIASYLRGSHSSFRNGSDNLLNADNCGIIDDPGLAGDRRDLMSPDTVESVQFPGKQVSIAGAIHSPNLKSHRFGGLVRISIVHDSISTLFQTCLKLLYFPALNTFE